LGAFVGSDARAGTERLEAAIGRKLAIGHSFVRWGGGLGDLPAWNVAGGRTPMLSFGRGVSALSVAGGRYDAWLGTLRGRSPLSVDQCFSATAGRWTGPSGLTRPSAGGHTWRRGGTCTICSPPMACAAHGCGRPTPMRSPARAAA